MNLLDFDFSNPDFYNKLIAAGSKAAIGLLLLILGFLVINWLSKLLVKVLQKHKVEPSLIPFFNNLFNYGLKILLILSVVSYWGVDITSFIAILGAAGFAVGMALSGTLQNFAGGIIILILRPFKVSDFIETQGQLGVVNQIQLFNTVLITPDNKTVVLPNGGLANGSIINYTKQDLRRVDLTFGISYNCSIDKARQIILNLALKNDLVLRNPEPFVGVSEHADSAVNLTARFWTQSKYYWDVYFFFMEYVKKEFDNQGISIPFPQQDIHIIEKH